MHRIKRLAACLIGFGLTAAVAWGAETPTVEAGVNPRAHPLGHIGPLPVTNSMVTSWVVAFVLIIVIRWAVGGAKLRPSRGQVVVETFVQGILDITGPIVGKRASLATFPLLVGLFTFILAQNWSGLVPGVGTVMIWDGAEHRWRDFVRPGNADLNLTFALALLSFVAYLYFIVRYAGFKAIFRDLFGNKADRREIPVALHTFLYVLFFGVGLIEIISILFRPVSLSFRLFGNIYGGESLMHVMSELTPWSRWVLPFPFYFLEMLIGVVQALVFTLLVSVYIGLITNHGDDHEAEPGAPH